MIKPYIEIPFLSDEQAKDLCGFELTYFCASKNDCDLLCIQADWRGSWETKYPKFDGTSHSSWGDEKVRFKFQDAPIIIGDDGELIKEKSKETDLETHFGLEIGFYEEDEDKQGGFLDINYLFHQNTKYGVVVYFAPKGWKGFDRKEILVEERID